MKRNGFSRFEGALLAGLAAAILVSSVGTRLQAGLAEKVLRLHVIANSDSAGDQALKLAVRDSVLARVEALTRDADSAEKARRAVEAGMSDIRRAAEETVAAAGRDDTINLTLGESYFPTKQYGDFALPAGRYDALRVVIGAGEGKNWWCVLFPPFCTAAVFADTAAAAGLGEEEIRFLTADGGYELRFRLAEWVSLLRERLGI